MSKPIYMKGDSIQQVARRVTCMLAGGAGDSGIWRNSYMRLFKSGIVKSTLPYHQGSCASLLACKSADGPAAAYRWTGRPGMLPGQFAIAMADSRSVYFRAGRKRWLAMAWGFGGWMKFERGNYDKEKDMLLNEVWKIEKTRKGKWNIQWDGIVWTSSRC